MAEKIVPMSANAARMFNAINAVLDGASNDERISLISNLAAFTLMNASAGSDWFFLKKLVEDFFTNVETMIVTNLEKNPNVPTINQILAGDRRQ